MSNALFKFTAHFGRMPVWGAGTAAWSAARTKRVRHNIVKLYSHVENGMDARNIVIHGELPAPRSSHTATLVDYSRMIIVGGHTSIPDTAVYEFVFDLNLWRKHEVCG